MQTRSGRLASQQPRELERFKEIIAGSKSYLEVGARHGDTFYEVMCSLPKGALGIAIDLPNGPWGGNSKKALEEAADELKQLGYHIELLFGDSKTYFLHQKFDAVLIDGDHTYSGVKSDFERFDGKIVALHDIAGKGLTWRHLKMGVPAFWQEIKPDYRHEEIILPDDPRPMGIGVIWKD